MRTYSAEILADTISPYNLNARLTTMVVTFPRCILPEVNTHRVFSRNSASSRARSIRKTIELVMTDPYIPLFTENHKGMSGPFIDSRRINSSLDYWLQARDLAVVSELKLLLGPLYKGYVIDIRDDWEKWVDIYYDRVYNHDDISFDIPNVHKQNANRLIEPFMWHEAIITSSYWDNFFKLRCSSLAQPEMERTADVMREAINNSTPITSDYHIPLVDNEGSESHDDFVEDMLDSAANCAKISYNDVNQTKEATHKHNVDMAIRLICDRHMSPFEHQAIAKPTFGKEYDDDRDLSGNLSPDWVQFRHALLENDLFQQKVNNLIK